MIGMIGYVFICTTIILGYAVYNLLTKLEAAQEDLLNAVEQEFSIKNKINNAIAEMRDIDSREAFEKDDETGTVFNALLEVVNELEMDDED